MYFFCSVIVQHQWGWDYSGSSNMAELQLLLEEKIMIRYDMYKRCYSAGTGMLTVVEPRREKTGLRGF